MKENYSMSFSLTRQKGFGLFLLLTSIVGWIASGVLILERLELYKDANHVASCDMNPFVSCSSVMKTAQASLFGFPNPFLGIVAFAVVITTAVVLLTGATLPKWYWLSLQVGVTLGFALVSFFWFTSVIVLGLLCPYCMVVWAMMIPIFVYTTAYNILHGNLFSKLRKDTAESIFSWAWVAVVLLFITVVASIFFKFMDFWV